LLETAELKTPSSPNAVELTAAILVEIRAEALARTTAIAFLLRCDRARSGRLIDDLENDFLQGRNHYPTTLVAADNLVTNRNGRRIAFANVNKDISLITCRKCEKKGHYANKCPERDKDTPQTGATLLMVDALMVISTILSATSSFFRMGMMQSRVKKKWLRWSSPAYVLDPVGQPVHG
jgi:hypothetical protein